MTCAASDMLERVQAELRRRAGELCDIAKSADMHYDTVRRIRDGANDPGYSKVRRLAESLGLIEGAGTPHAIGTPPAQLEGKVQHAA